MVSSWVLLGSPFRRIDELYGRPKLELIVGKLMKTLNIFTVYLLDIYIFIFTHCILYSFNGYRFLRVDCQ